MSSARPPEGVSEKGRFRNITKSAEALSPWQAARFTTGGKASRASVFVGAQWIMDTPMDLLRSL